MYVVGLAGGIGSGKTTVSDRFAELGVTIADADVASRTITEPGTPVLGAMVDRYGKGILQQDGSLNRAKLRPMFFSNPKERRWLEKLSHIPINAELRRIMESADSGYSILILSAGPGRSSVMNRLLVIDVPPALQLARVSVRDNNTREQVQAIMDIQPSREERLALADDVLVNDGSIAQLLSGVDKLHNRYQKLSSTG